MQQSELRVEETGRIPRGAGDILDREQELPRANPNLSWTRPRTIFQGWHRRDGVTHRNEVRAGRASH